MGINSPHALHQSITISSTDSGLIIPITLTLHRNVLGTFSLAMTSLIDVNGLCKSFDVVGFSVCCSGPKSFDVVGFSVCCSGPKSFDVVGFVGFSVNCWRYFSLLHSSSVSSLDGVLWASSEKQIMLLHFLLKSCGAPLNLVTDIFLRYIISPTDCICGNSFFLQLKMLHCMPFELSSTSVIEG